MSITAIQRIGFLALLAAMGPGVVSAGGEAIVVEYDLEVGSAAIDSPVEAAATVKLRIEVHNRGLAPWSAENDFALAYHWFSADGEIVVWDGDRSPITDPIQPGESRTIDAIVRTPERAGDYLLQWDVVREGVLWVSEADPTPVEFQPVGVVATHAFSLVRASTPRVLHTNGERRAVLVLRNDGTQTWPDDGSTFLAYHWLASDGEVAQWEGRRVRVNRPVAPGEILELEAVVEALPSAGRMRLQWDMVEEGVCWFSERDADPEPSLVVLVVPTLTLNPVLWSVLIVIAAALSVARGWRPRSPGLWGAADVMWCVAALVVKQGWVLNGAGLRFSATGWWLTATTATLIGLALLALPARLRPWVSWATAFVTTAILFADLLHERFFGDLVSVAALHSVSQIGQVEASVRSLLAAGDLWFWADLPVAIVLVWAVTRTPAQMAGRRRFMVMVGLAVAAVGVLGSVALAGRSASTRQVFHTTHLARQIGVLNLHALDLGRSAARGIFQPELDESDYLAVVDYFDDRRESRAGSGPLFGAAKGRNLVMIQVESLQEFVIGFRVGDQEITPFLNSLAGENLRFTNVIDQTEEGRSSDSELATQVSLLPPDRGAAAFLYADNDYIGLASILAEHGYRTASAVPFDGGFWNRRVTHRAYGYESSRFAEDFSAGEKIGWGLNDRAFLSQAVERMAELGEPWCAYLLTLSLHHPFDGFPEHRKLLDVGEWEGTPFGNYLHTMHHFDHALSDFVTALDEAGLMDRSVIALWGDHDAGFEWRSEIAAAMGVPHNAAGWFLSQQVPLVIRLPGAAARDELIRTPAGHADVAPTLLALLGVDPARYAFVGRNLLGSPGSGPVIGEYRCWRDATHLYLRRGPLVTDGDCIELATMTEIDSEACVAGFEEARRQVEISGIVLDQDLQARVHRSLEPSP